MIALVQHRERMNSSLPATGNLLREYVQLETPANANDWNKHVPLMNGSARWRLRVPVLMPDGVTQAFGVDNPHYLGPVIAAQKDRPVRLVFYNLLPKGSDGDLYIPADTSMMGAGYGPLNNWPSQTEDRTVMDDVRNPVCTETPENRRYELHERQPRHGASAWRHHALDQRRNPAPVDHPRQRKYSLARGRERGAGAGYGRADATAVACPIARLPDDGCMAFYYTNQQSARLLFYHDHAFGTTRLNVYLGEAAGYLITDATEQDAGRQSDHPRRPDPAHHPGSDLRADAAQLAEQDPTWDTVRWGSYGTLWYHHVYMPAQNPGDPSGMSAFGRWMYGPWFWPPATRRTDLSPIPTTPGPATWTTRRPGITTPIPSANRR